MMGPYAYYDTPFLDDIPAELQYHHECMWSGECCSSQTSRLTFSSGPSVPGATGTVPITVGGTGYITLTTTTTTHLDPSSKSIVSVTLNEQKVPTKLVERYPEVIDESSQSSTISTPEPRPKPRLKTKKTRITTKKGSTSKHSSSSDNKKLRHREVEKNRHRQLQAMVKTLSEKIPGRLDKETQVQTMKRAARYCIFLRDSLSLLSCGQPMMVKEKLEKNYLRSCDNVERMMSQQMSAR